MTVRERGAELCLTLRKMVAENRERLLRVTGGALGLVGSVGVDTAGVQPATRPSSKITHKTDLHFLLTCMVFPPNIVVYE